jgi:hypothetical protein
VRQIVNLHSYASRPPVDAELFYDIIIEKAVNLDVGYWPIGFNHARRTNARLSPFIPVTGLLGRSQVGQIEHLRIGPVDGSRS